MAAYYNEFDPKTAAWLRELIKAGLIADGEVDERSIADVRPADLTGFVQCHFFAGIGGWSYALRLAGWPDDRAVWTGSCPCQPFSSAGAQAGGHDPRDLWPAWFELLRECRPVVVFGEQVESAIAHGWLDRLCDDLEGEGYAVGAAGLSTPSVGGHHIRQRLWFVADAKRADQRGHSGDPRSETGACGGDARPAHGDAVGSSGAVGIMADSQRWTAERHGLEMAGSARGAQGATQELERLRSNAGNGCDAGELADAYGAGQRSSSRRVRNERHDARWSRETGYWSGCEWTPCRDGKSRPIEPGIFPLVDGLSGGRVALGRAVQSPAASLSEEEAAYQFSRTAVLRGAGNAIVPQVAAEFISAYIDVDDTRRAQLEEKPIADSHA